MLNIILKTIYKNFGISKVLLKKLIKLKLYNEIGQFKLSFILYLPITYYFLEKSDCKKDPI